MDTRRLLKRPLVLDEIVGCLCNYREAKGQWPTKYTPGFVGIKDETWQSIDTALRDGFRGLPGGSSLAKLIADNLGGRNIHNLPPLTEEKIALWLDEHHRAHGEWPTAKSGIIPNSGGEKWSAIDMALRKGVRSLPGGSSLARFLARHRGVRNRKALAPYTVEGILQWCDAHFHRTGTWPTRHAGPIVDAPGETWLAVEMALRHGRRGLPGGSSLALLLAEGRAVRNVWTRPDLSMEGILTWIDAQRHRNGTWPHVDSGPIPEAPGETWNAVNHALVRGSRGLPGGSSLADLLARERGVRNPAGLSRLTLKFILSLAVVHHREKGEWPTKNSGPVLDAPGETWSAIDTALQQGHRGLRGGSSLARLLAKYHKKRNHLGLPPLSYRKILRWCDVHFQRTGHYPKVNSGDVMNAPGERWDVIDSALRQGHRGLPCGSSLLQLLVRKRGVRDPLRPPPLTEEGVVLWAKRHSERTGKRPKYNSGPIEDAPGETWAGVDWALRYGKRGFPGGASLAKLLDKHGLE